MNKVLIVEDDEGLTRGITFTLEKDGYVVKPAGSIREAKEILAKEDTDLMILDLNLPDGDGLDLCEWTRERYEISIIILTARDLETDEVLGLEKGADDYVTKPFSLAALKARVAANLRKKGKELRCGDIRLFSDSMKVYRNDERIELSTTEYKLLKYMMENQSIVLTKEQLLYVVWDQDANFVEDNTLQVNIRRLRVKLGEDPANPEYIHTKRNIGYVMEYKK